MESRESQEQEQGQLQNQGQEQPQTPEGTYVPPTSPPMIIPNRNGARHRVQGRPRAQRELLFPME